MNTKIDSHTHLGEKKMRNVRHALFMHNIFLDDHQTEIDIN